MTQPGCYTPGKETRYPLYRRLGGPQGQSGRVWKTSPIPAFDPRVVQPVASRYTEPYWPMTSTVTNKYKSVNARFKLVVLNYLLPA